MSKNYIRKHLSALELRYDLIIEKTKRGYVATMDDGLQIKGLDGIVDIIKEISDFEEANND